MMKNITKITNATKKMLRGAEERGRRQGKTSRIG
jgi:hypothetical protein